MEEPLALIETMRWNRGIRLWALHRDRLTTSAHELGFGLDMPALQATLTASLKGWPDHTPARLRLLVDPDGRPSCTAGPLTDPPAGPVRLHLATSVHLDPSDPLTRHKTTRRAVYTRALDEARAAGCDEALLLDAHGHLAEGSRTSVFLQLAGRLYTPPLQAGILPGVYRCYLLRKFPGITERTLTPADLSQADAVYVCNAVWGIRLAISE